MAGECSVANAREKAEASFHRISDGAPAMAWTRLGMRLRGDDVRMGMLERQEAMDAALGIMDNPGWPNGEAKQRSGETLNCIARMLEVAEKRAEREVSKIAEALAVETMKRNALRAMFESALCDGNENRVRRVRGRLRRRRHHACLGECGE